MLFSPPLQQGTLIKRYKRFLADIELCDGSQITIHCPNTGSMRNCLFPGEKVWFSTSDNPKRKYPNTWELAQTDTGHLIGINTGRANALAAEAIADGVITELQGYSQLRREVKYGNENSRIDLLLEDARLGRCYIEVKSCTLLEQQQGYFPDAVSTRGQKHLRELIEMVHLGHRAVLLFVVQHSGIDRVSAAKHIDPDYAQQLFQAHQAGVEILAYCTEMSTEGLHLAKSCPVSV
ncbi:DNA/RNA nuclease SfsA [Shewanella algidipiscicola]|uniref:Sugar fermentation stimulation protein homolog n=1 Tax=Shewanella algidipiscicola TaxID=614070 RepID=A0ABQ4PAV6_9GAMM|nr:DNA/RNA nuclease SfsA [Shewanella algidipiscicola]GIU44658.1 sugar fermentation stimulation protein [Shewanella algidipiscicola]